MPFRSLIRRIKAKFFYPGKAEAAVTIFSGGVSHL
jgi:hypothetical protein